MAHAAGRDGRWTAVRCWNCTRPAAAKDGRPTMAGLVRGRSRPRRKMDGWPLLGSYAAGRGGRWTGQTPLYKDGPRDGLYAANRDGKIVRGRLREKKVRGQHLG